MHSYSIALRSVDQSTIRVVFKVQKGSSTSEIARQLFEQHLIRSPFAFKWYVKQTGMSSQLKSGTFVLQSSMTTPQVVDTLVGGKTAMVQDGRHGFRYQTLTLGKA